MKKLFYLITVALLSSCHEADGKRSTIVEQEPIADRRSLTTASSQPQPLRLYDARALTQVYERVFPKNGNRHKRCPGSPSWCQQSLFSIEEARALGTFDPKNGLTSFKVSDELSLGYLRALRGMLARECQYLVDQEWAESSPDVPNNEHLLVKVQGLPNSKTLDDFVRRILGIDQSDMEYQSMGSAYGEAFAKSIPSEASPQDYKKVYIATCIALGTDPAIYIY